METLRSTLADIQKTLSSQASTLEHLTSTLRGHQGHVTSRLATCEDLLQQHVTSQTSTHKHVTSHVVYHLTLHAVLLLLVVVTSWSFGFTKHLASHSGNPVGVADSVLHGDLVKVKEAVGNLEEMSREMKLGVDHIQDSMLLHMGRNLSSSVFGGEENNYNRDPPLRDSRRESPRSRLLSLQSVFLKHIRAMMTEHKMATQAGLKSIETVQSDMKDEIKKLRNESSVSVSNMKYESSAGPQELSDGFLSELRQEHVHVLFLLRLILFLPVLLFTIFIIWSRKIIIDRRFQAFINKQLGRHRGHIVSELHAHVQTEACLVKDDVRRVIERSNEDIKDDISKVKDQIIKDVRTDTDKQIQYQNRDLADVIEKEAFLSRELIRSPDEGYRNVYEFYFPVRNFDKRVGSGVWVFSCPWYVNQFGSCLKGAVWFKPDGTVFIKLIDGRYPKVVGLKPKPRNSFSFKVSVVDEGGKIEEKVLGGSHVGEHDEVRQGILLGIWGDWIGSFPCDDLRQGGYVKCGTLLVKYVITVQEDGLAAPLSRIRHSSRQSVRQGFLMGRPLSVQQ